MSDTWRGRRRKFGAKKTRDHNARGQWSGQNDGRRLRSLVVDHQDYDRARRTGGRGGAAS